jgi:hypothetical protein
MSAVFSCPAFDSQFREKGSGSFAVSGGISFFRFAGAPFVTSKNDLNATPQMAFLR